MSPAQLNLVRSRQSSFEPSPFGNAPRRDLGHVLRTMGLLTGERLRRAQDQAQHLGLGLGRYLRANRMISAQSLLKAHEWSTGARPVDLRTDPPDPRLIDRVGAARCLRMGVLPWRRIGGVVLVATSDPEALGSLDLLPDPVLPVLANDEDIRSAILRLRSRQLAQRAEQRTDEDLSCRDWPIRSVRNVSAILALFCLAWAFAGTASFVSAALFWTLATMAALLSLKLAAMILHLVLGPVREDDPQGVTTPIARRPAVSVLVPMYRETEIADTLVRRLSRLTYPRELLEIILVVEESDRDTRTTLVRTSLPPGFRVVEVPVGSIRTKPRALNYALDFCRGQIIGVYDAEDAPEPDQIDRVVDRFLRRGPKVACLQGRLDFYNPRSNWLARCFTIEYSTWFRVILPGLQRLGWPVPLGGTTLFFRREALETLGAWDAHNVTEDADLGLRLARFGYRTELVDTVTYEEANCRLWPWIRQRSRWLKGYAVTYAVHMRAPRSTLRDLGAWKFLGMQVIFLGTLSQFLLAPLLWSFWPALFGYWHPFMEVLGEGAIKTVASVFLSSEAISLAIGMLAVSTPDRRFLLPWVPTLAGYFPLATIAAFKGLSELRGRPFFWDKTRHGRDAAAADSGR